MASFVGIRVFWDMKMCSLANMFRRLGATHCLNLHSPTVHMEKSDSSETSVHNHQTASGHIAEDSNIPPLFLI